MFQLTSISNQTISIAYILASTAGSVPTVQQTVIIELIQSYFIALIINVKKSDNDMPIPLTIIKALRL